MADANDFERLVAVGLWRSAKSYAVSGEDKHGVVWMHKLVRHASDRTDHIDGDTLNNRSGNLRPASHTENMRNTRIRKDSSHGFKGVEWHNRHKRFNASVKVFGKRYRGPVRRTAREAAADYDILATKHYGEFARTNKSMGLL